MLATTASSAPTSRRRNRIVEGIGDLFLLVPKTINVSSPAFQQAAKTCSFHRPLGRQ